MKNSGYLNRKCVKLFKKVSEFDMIYWIKNLLRFRVTVKY